MSTLQMFSRIFFAVSVAIAAGGAVAGPSRLKGPGGQVEAYGMMTATYYTALAAIEACGKDRRYSKESEETARNYLHENQTAYDNVTRKLSAAALRSGGEKERDRIAAEIRSTMPYIQAEAKNKAEGMITAKDSCSNILANLRRGVMDLKSRHSNQLDLFKD